MNEKVGASSPAFAESERQSIDPMLILKSIRFGEGLIDAKIKDGRLGPDEAQAEKQRLDEYKARFFDSLPDGTLITAEPTQGFEIPVRALSGNNMCEEIIKAKPGMFFSGSIETLWYSTPIVACRKSNCYIDLNPILEGKEYVVTDISLLRGQKWVPSLEEIEEPDYTDDPEIPVV